MIIKANVSIAESINNHKIIIILYFTAYQLERFSTIQIYFIVFATIVENMLIEIRVDISH